MRQDVLHKINDKSITHRISHKLAFETVEKKTEAKYYTPTVSDVTHPRNDLISLVSQILKTFSRVCKALFNSDNARQKTASISYIGFITIGFMLWVKQLGDLLFLTSRLSQGESFARGARVRFSVGWQWRRVAGGALGLGSRRHGRSCCLRILLLALCWLKQLLMTDWPE